MRALLTALLLYSIMPAAAVDFRHDPIADTRATVAVIDPMHERLRLFLADEQGMPFKHLATLAAWLRAHGQTPVLAMNAGMYEPDLRPVGLFVAAGKLQAPLNTADGTGNFYLKPNGVFFVRPDGTPGVLETSRYAAAGIHAVLATQSGPLLVDAGIIHPAFNPHSTSRLLRNGVGVDENGKVVFAISDGPVSLYEFAVFFRDTLHCANALYLDGSVSSLYAPAIGRDDERTVLGPMLAVVIERGNARAGHRPRRSPRADPHYTPVEPDTGRTAPSPTTPSTW